jgi:hypothetical protein
VKEVSSTAEVGEPEDGWVEGRAQFPQALVTTTLCRYTGFPFDQEGCVERKAGQHPDFDCWEHFHSATALRYGLIEVDVPVAVKQVRYGPDGALGEAL